MTPDDDWGTFLRVEGTKAIEWAAGYLDRVGDMPVLSAASPDQIRAALPALIGNDTLLADSVG